MKPSSPLSLFIFLHLTCAVPIPITFPPDCQSLWCQSILSSRPQLANRPTQFSNPHFPSHQLSAASEATDRHLDKEEFNNTPMTPPLSSEPSQSLSADHPLVSSYLQSLANPALKNPSEPHPSSPSSAPAAQAAKPTSALPHLRKIDAIRYWALPLRLSKVNGEKESITRGRLLQPGTKCSGGMGEIMTVHARLRQPTLVAKEYSDFIVVGIVVLFLVAVVAMEAWEKFNSLRATSSTPKFQRGEIYLEDDDEALYIVEKPITLQSPPLPESKLPTSQETPATQPAVEDFAGNNASGKV